MKIWAASLITLISSLSYVVASNPPVYTGATLFYIEQAKSYTGDLTFMGGLWDDVTPVSELFFNNFSYTPYSGLTIIGPIHGVPALGFYPPQIVSSPFSGTGRFVILDTELNKTLVRFAYCLYGVGGLPPNDHDCDGIEDSQDPDDDNDGIEDGQDPDPGGGGATNGGGSTAGTTNGSTTAGNATAGTTNGSTTAGNATAGTTNGTTTAGNATAGTTNGSTTAGNATAGTTNGTTTAGNATAGTTNGTTTAGNATAGTTNGSTTAGNATAGSTNGSTNGATNGSVGGATNGTDKNKGDLRIAIPYEHKRDIISNTDILEPAQDDQSFFNLFRLFNEWLWIIIGVVAFLVLLYGGFLLMTSRGDAKELKKAQDLILYAVIGIIITLLAYVFVNILVNLFS